MAESPCAGCGKPMGYGDYTEALGKEYHAECFKCCVCQKLLGDEPFVDRNGAPAHKQCVSTPKAVSSTADMCAGCSVPLQNGEDCLRVTNGAATLVYHSRCVKCNDCGQPIASAKYALSGGKPVHVQCMHGAEATKGAAQEFGEDDLCRRCKTRIQGQRKTIPGFGHFHLTCFRCSKCGLGIRVDQTFTKDPTTGEPVCKNCQ